MPFDVDTLILLDAVRRSMFAVLCAASLLVGIDSIAIIFSYPETPPHRPKANATSWLLFSASCVSFTVYVLLNRLPWIGPDSSVESKRAMILFLAGLIAAATSRAVTRAKNPWLTIGSAVGMSLFGVLLVLLDGPA